MLDNFMFSINSVYFFKIGGQIVQGRYRGRNGKMYLSNLTKSLDVCHLLTVHGATRKIAESDLKKAFYDAQDELNEGIPF